MTKRLALLVTLVFGFGLFGLAGAAPLPAAGSGTGSAAAKMAPPQPPPSPVPAAKPVVGPTVLPKAPASQPAGTVEPTTAAEAIDAAAAAVDMARAKNWLGFSAALIWLVIFGLKLSKLFEKIGKRWIYIVVPALSIAAMFLTKFAGGVSWANAWLVLASGPVVALANDFVKRGILGKEPETPIVTK